MKAKTYALDDLVVVVMRGTGFTPLEKTMMDSGDPERVVAMRHDFQHMMTKLFTDTIEEKCRLLGASPEMGRGRPELAPDLRSFPVGNYVIFYRPVRGGVEVVRVLRAARDIPSLF